VYSFSQSFSTALIGRNRQYEGKHVSSGIEWRGKFKNKGLINAGAV